MAWRRQINMRLARSTGMRVVQRDGRYRVVRDPRRELSAPGFIFSSVRSGSTLLRMILNSHSQIYAPHELHLRHIRVSFEIPAAGQAMAALGLDERELTAMTWDRLLTTVLRRSGKTVLVEKTPNLVFHWEQVARAWPDARFIYLLRHPAAILDSWQRARTTQTEQEAIAGVTRYLRKLREARAAAPGITVRYEELTADPVREARRLCAFLGVGFEPAMVEYGRADHGPLVAGLGDWHEKIRSGAVQSARPVPRIELPADLRALAADLGY
ncbi:sulfotransferase family protein [Actinoplanes sp. NPDC049599]|uniref:sulfotransferase family protein n=1 Tax=Actinoplanes sp. NPDC049599 TaxID=3363903 RepID=UPI00379866CE